MSTSDDTSLIWGYNIVSRLLSIMMLSYSLWLIELNLYPFWPTFWYCSVLKTAIRWKKKRIAFKILRVFTYSPVKGKDQIGCLNFFILGAISYCNAWFPQRRVLAEKNVSMVYKISCRSVQFTSNDRVFRWLRSSSRAREPSHPDSVGMCCLQTTQYHHTDIRATRVDSSRAIPIIGILFVVDYISQ